MIEPRARYLLFALSVCIVVTGFLASFLLDHPRPPDPREESPEDARRIAYEVAQEVALATDDDMANDETPAVPSCREALEHPTDGACRLYEATLRDLLENAKEPCTRARYLHAEDLSCVPETFYGRGSVVALFEPPQERKGAR